MYQYEAVRNTVIIEWVDCVHVGKLYSVPLQSQWKVLFLILFMDFFFLLAAASELDRHLQALLKDLVMTQPEFVIPEIQLHCKELMVNFNRFVLLLF